LLLLLLLLFELYNQKLTDYTYNKGVAGTKRKDTTIHISHNCRKEMFEL